MEVNYRKVLPYFVLVGVGLTVCAIAPWVIGQKLSPERARAVADSAPGKTFRVTAPGVLLMGGDDDQTIAKVRNRASGRSPATEPDAKIDADFAALAKEFLARGNFAAEEEKLKEFFPDGKGVNRSIRLTLLLAARTIDNADSYSEIQLASRVQSEILAHAESSVVSLNAGLAALPRGMSRERQTAIRLLSTIAFQQPELRGEVKTSLLAEAGRSGNSPEGGLALTALLRVNPSSEWFQEVNTAYERLHPGTDLSEVVAMNIVAL